MNPADTVNLQVGIQTMMNLTALISFLAGIAAGWLACNKVRDWMDGPERDVVGQLERSQLERAAARVQARKP
jgi:hypothetical protein